MNQPPQQMGLTADQKISLSERKLWLVSHNAPPDMALISKKEMDDILGGIKKEAQARIVAQTTLRLAQKYINELMKVAEASEQTVQQMDASTLAGQDPMKVPAFPSLRSALSNLRKFLKDHQFSAGNVTRFPGT